MNQKRIAARTGYDDVHAGIVELLEPARRASVRAVNALMTATYWEIGRRIIEAEQGGKRRADYGERLIERLAVDLTKRFGRGFGARNLCQMRGFYLAYPDNVQTPSAKFAARQGEKLRTPSAKFDSPKIRQTPSGESIADPVSRVPTREFGTAQISESSSRESLGLSATVKSETLSRDLSIERPAGVFPLSWSHDVRLVRQRRSQQERERVIRDRTGRARHRPAAIHFIDPLTVPQTVRGTGGVAPCLNPRNR